MLYTTYSRDRQAHAEGTHGVDTERNTTSPWLRNWVQLGCQGRCIIWGSQLSVACPDVAVLAALWTPPAPKGLDQIKHTPGSPSPLCTGKKRSMCNKQQVAVELMQQFNFPARMVNKQIKVALSAVDTGVVSSDISLNPNLQWMMLLFLQDNLFLCRDRKW